MTFYNMPMTLIDLARSTELFRGLSAEEVEGVLYRLNGVKKTFAKDETVVHAGLEAKRMFAVASGRLRVYEQTSEVHSVFVREIAEGEVLGLWIAHMPDVTCWPGTVVAVEPCTLLSLDIAAARRMMGTSGPTVARIGVNASKMLSRELFTTWRKLMVMDAPTIESRIRVYLSELDNETGRTGSVTVPFDRERMAEYFGVTRPALSRTLGQMRDRGLLTWRKSVFKINF